MLNTSLPTWIDSTFAGDISTKSIWPQLNFRLPPNTAVSMKMIPQSLTFRYRATNHELALIFNATVRPRKTGVRSFRHQPDDDQQNPDQDDDARSGDADPDGAGRLQPLIERRHAQRQPDHRRPERDKLKEDANHFRFALAPHGGDQDQHSDE